MPKRVTHKNGRGAQKVLTVKGAKPRAFVSSARHHSGKSTGLFRQRSEEHRLKTRDSDSSSSDYTHSIQIPAFYADAKKSRQIGQQLSTVENQLSRLTLPEPMAPDTDVSCPGIRHNILERLQAQLDYLKAENQREHQVQQDLLTKLTDLNLNNVHYHDIDKT